MTRQSWSQQTKQLALAMFAEEIPVRSISARLLVPLETVKSWCYDQASGRRFVAIKREKTKSGSGVIAGPCYRKGYAGWR